MEFWPLYWAIFLGIVSAMIVMEVGLFGLNYLVMRSQHRKMKEMQERMASGNLTDADMDVIGASMPGMHPSFFSQLGGHLGQPPNQMDPPSSGTQGGSGQYL